MLRSRTTVSGSGNGFHRFCQLRLWLWGSGGMRIHIFWSILISVLMLIMFLFEYLSKAGVCNEKIYFFKKLTVWLKRLLWPKKRRYRVTWDPQLCSILCFVLTFLLFFIKISVSNVTIDVTVDVERWQLCIISSHKPFWNLKITVFYRAPVQKLLLGWQL